MFTTEHEIIRSFWRQIYRLLISEHIFWLLEFPWKCFALKINSFFYYIWRNYFAYLDKTPWFLNSSSGQFLNSMYLWRHKLTQFWGTIIAEKWQLFFLSGTLSLHYIHCVTVDQISKAYIYAFSNTYVRGCQIDDTWGNKNFKTKNGFKGTFMMEKILNGIGK